jgi:magnesium-transporting ATPase (P-type)
MAGVTPTGLGLSSEQARLRLGQHGPNVLPSAPRPGVLEIGLRQLKNPLIYVLIAAAVAALALGDFGDAGFIGVVLLVNTCIGGWQEWNAEQQSQALQRMLRVRATVLRDGRLVEVDAEQVVPGDVVALESGQRVPADLRLLEAHGLEIEESLLTGESLPVLKDARWRGVSGAQPAERRDMAFAGSTVTRGRGHGEVVATGVATVVGGLAITMTETERGTPPLVERMERFSRQIALSVLGSVIVLGAVGVLVHGRGVAEMFMFGVALAVSAIPEGLPVALTVALAIGARRMANRGAIVRRLPAVESLGSCTLVASDKTGTLTCNELTVRAVQLADGRRFEVSGAGYDPRGAIALGEPGAEPAGDDAALRSLLEVAVACNEADLVEQDGGWSWRGDPTDVALLVLARKAGVVGDPLLLDRPRTGMIPFEPERRFAASFHATDGGTWIAVKGAPERVIGMCRLAESERAAVLDAATGLAAAGYRVLALASGRLPRRFSPSETPVEPRDLDYLGLLGLIDPLRPGARDAIRRCREAGIRVVMVTGDHPLTALAIARDLDIGDGPGHVLTGQELESEARSRLRAALDGVTVFARVTPAQKLELVEVAQEAGHFVAVTGDGVNDAPALRRANVGIAMGRSGTDVAREASDLVLSDDNFATIVGGIEEGRIAYQNIRNVIYLLIAAGIAEVATLGLAVVVGLPLPLLPAQLLWLNIVTNGIQYVALAFERGHGDVLGAPPRRPDESVFDRLMIERGLLAGAWMAAIGFTAFVLMLQAGLPVETARSHLLLLMVLMQNVDAFNARSETLSVFRNPLSNNPLLAVGVAVALLLHVGAMYVPLMQRVLTVGPMTADEWIFFPALALSLLVVMELHKLGWKRRRRNGEPRQLLPAT